jgi:catechol 2,3-dioxygenase-like lactoylglutathione lyase family enzyme
VTKEGRRVNAQISVIALGVSDLQQAKQFYVDLGCTIRFDQGSFVALNLGEASSGLSLSSREGLAKDAACLPKATGFACSR